MKTVRMKDDGVGGGVIAYLVAVRLTRKAYVWPDTSEVAYLSSLQGQNSPVLQKKISFAQHKPLRRVVLHGGHQLTSAQLQPYSLWRDF